MVHGLGRREEFDEKSRNYPIRTLLPEKPPRSYTWRCKSTLDQGSEGACVGFAWVHELIARPVEVTALSSTDAFDVYKAAQKIDEWEGENYSGTSILAGAKIVQGRGWMDEYRWAFGIEDVALTIGYRGPVILGVNWYENMYTPDRSGYIHPTGNLLGGHAILARGYSKKTGRFLLHNSWGKDWGKNGSCYISYENLDYLLSQRGEAVIPVKRSHG